LALDLFLMSEGMNKKQSVTLVFFVISLLLGTFFAIYLTRDKNDVENNENLSFFKDEDLGLYFEYPAEFGNVSADIYEPGRRPGGTTGNKLVGTFSNFSGLEFGGITDDFSAGREGLITDTRGFRKEDGKYYFKFVSVKPDMKIEPYKVIQKDFGEMLILDDKSFEGERSGVEGPVFGVGEGRLAGLVNLKSGQFSGIVFYNSNPEELSLEEFEKILDSLVISRANLKTFVQSKSPVSYSIDIPTNWFWHEVDQGVIFTPTETVQIPQDTEGWALGSYFIINVENIFDSPAIESYEDWLEQNAMADREDITINGLSMKRAVLDAAGASGQAIRYVYLVNTQWALTILHFPYDTESEATKVFESAIKTFQSPVK